VHFWREDECSSDPGVKGSGASGRLTE
jgi:hypothetical protein